MKYQFIVEATITLGIQVEADTMQEAVAKAKIADVQSLCYQCGSSQPGKWCTSGELDVGYPGGELLTDYHGPGTFREANAAWVDQ